MQVTNTLSFSHTAGDWNSITIGDITWTVDAQGGNYYYHINEGFKYQISCVSYDISIAMLESLVQSRLPSA